MIVLLRYQLRDLAKRWSVWVDRIRYRGTGEAR